MRTKYTLLLILVTCTITIFSCKKSSGSNKDNYNYLQGYWQGTITAVGSSSTNYGFGVLIKPGNVCRLFINVNGATIDTTAAPISFDETWSVTNKVLKITGQLAEGTGNLTTDQTTLSGMITVAGSQPDNFLLTKH
jgi:hypothetical protein